MVFILWILLLVKYVQSETDFVALSYEYSKTQLNQDGKKYLNNILYY